MTKKMIFSIIFSSMSQISSSPAFTTNESLQNSLTETVRKMSDVSFELK